MGRITRHTEISLDDLEIGKGQSRTQDMGKEIDELADSIKKQGLLQPIVVCRGKQPGKWEILTGQRRFLACKQLGMKTITAAVMDESVPEEQAKAISITENLIRRKLAGKDLIDGITYLYLHYGSSVKTVSEATGISASQVRQYVKYPRLSAVPAIKRMVDEGTVHINTALKALDASPVDDSGNVDHEIASKLAQAMSKMSGAQQKRIVEERKKDPGKDVNQVIEDAKGSSRVTQLIVTVTQDTDSAIVRYARETDQSKSEAALDLIEEALKDLDLLEKE